MWARENMPWGDLVAESLERERIAAAGLLAGGLAYRLFFWIVPLGLVIAAVLSFWVESDAAGLEDAARDFGLGGATSAAAIDAIQSGARSRWYLLVIGVALLIWFGSGVVRALNVAHAVAWRLRPERVQHGFRAGAIFSALMIGAIVVSGAAATVREATPGPGIVVTLSLACSTSRRSSGPPPSCRAARRAGGRSFPEPSSSRSGRSSSTSGSSSTSRRGWGGRRSSTARSAPRP